MKTILSVALLVAALGASAYIWNERYHKRPVNAPAAATARPKAAENIAAQVDLNAAKKRCFDASKEAILKELKAPQTASFANLSDVTFQRGEAESYQMSSYVDAQDALGAPVRMKWATLFDKEEKLVWMKIDDDELEPLEDVLRRLKGLPSREGERGLAANEAERVRQTTEERSPKELEELRDPKYRESLHEYAEKYLTTRMELQNHRDIKHSKLPKKDDKYAACYWLGNDVWEATGLVESIPPHRTRRVRQPWKVSMAVTTDNKPEVLAYKLGKEEIGNPDVPRVRAGVKPTLSK
jgi:hypothetical protein